MLPPQHRLPGYKIIDLLHRGRIFSTPLFSLYFLKTDREQTQIGIVVPVKLSKKAAVRNRTKRLIREACYQLLSTVPNNYDVLIICRRLFKEEKLAGILPLVKSLFLNLK